MLLLSTVLTLLSSAEVTIAPDHHVTVIGTRIVPASAPLCARMSHASMRTYASAEPKRGVCKPTVYHFPDFKQYNLNIYYNLT